MARKCGECTVCCTVMKIDDLQKAPWVPCVHLGPRGCTVYAAGPPTRPQVCADFRCGWHMGHGSNADRPDRSGAMLTSAGVDPNTQLGRAGVVECAQVYETADHSLERHRAIAMVQALARNVVVILMHRAGNRRVLGPAAILDRIAPTLLAAGARQEK